MKFLKSHKVVHTEKLFQGKYKYKLVISLGVAAWFRGADLEKAKFHSEDNNRYYTRSSTPGDKIYGKKLITFLSELSDWHIRVETPYLSVYLNNLTDLESLVKFSHARIKYVSIPNPDTESKLLEKTVIVKNLDFDYRVTVGATRQNYSSFVQWSKDNPKVRLPKRAAKDLSKDSSPGGGYFYVKDDKSLTMVKMFLGRTITKVENVVRA